MNLVDKLMKLDTAELEKMPISKIKAKRLTEIMGEDAMITVRAIKGERYTELTTNTVDSKGKVRMDKIYDANALVAAEGIVDPDVRSAELQKHFGCASPKELVKVLFPGGELAKIAGEITDLSGYGDDDEAEEEVKN